MQNSGWITLFNSPTSCLEEEETRYNHTLKYNSGIAAGLTLGLGSFVLPYLTGKYVTQIDGLAVTSELAIGSNEVPWQTLHAPKIPLGTVLDVSEIAYDEKSKRVRGLVQEQSDTNVWVTLMVAERGNTQRFATAI